MKITAWLQDIGLWESAVLVKLDESEQFTPSATNGDVHFVTAEMKLFLEKAQKHYCEICDKFYKDVRGAKAHIRFKHK